MKFCWADSHIKLIKLYLSNVTGLLAWEGFTRDGFTVKLMKVKLQGPSLARAPSQTLGGALAVS